MISTDSLTAIAHIFCGDIEGYYSYKSGPKLVSFFYEWLRTDDEYDQGFPSRWSESPRTSQSCKFIGTDPQRLNKYIR